MTIRPRGQKNMSKANIINKMPSDRALRRARADGGEVEISAAAKADPDAQPFSDAGMRLVPRAKTLRRALGLTQEEFATRFQIPLGTLRDWEQGRAEPDQTARAYLRVIAGDAEAVVRALGVGQGNLDAASSVGFSKLSPKFREIDMALKRAKAVK